MVEAFGSVVSGELLSLMAALTQSMRAAFRSDEELGVRVMGHLAAAGRRGASQRETARALSVAEATVSRRCDQLEAAGLVHRTPHPTDRRVKMMHLTAAGLEQLGLCTASAAATLGAALRDLSPDEQAALSRLAQRLSCRTRSREICAGCRVGGC